QQMSDDEIAAYPDGAGRSPFQAAPAAPAAAQPTAVPTPAPTWHGVASWFKVNNCHDVCVGRLTESVAISSTPWRVSLKFKGQPDNAAASLVPSACVDVFTTDGIYQTENCLNNDGSFEPKLPAGTYFFKLTTYNIANWSMVVEQLS